MKLKDIIRNIDPVEVLGSLDTEITAITCDSREVTPGSLFIAVKGFASDGHKYIPSALEKGAVAVVCEDGDFSTRPSALVEMTEIKETASVEMTGPVISSEAKRSREISWVKVRNSRHAVAMAADAFYGHPSGKLSLVGITGTNGKTTTVTLLYRLFKAMGHPSGLLSTIANYVDDKRLETANTTADPITINRLLAEMVDAGCSYCFMEVSSIGVEQERVAGLQFAAGIFSNLTHDHLDYHKTFAEYLRCKKLFFDNLPKEAYAIINVDDKNGPVMVQNTAAKVVTYACKRLADHTARILEQSFEGMLLKIDGKETWTRLVGAHNAYNLLAIYTTAVCLGAPVDEVLVALSNLASAPGRLENIRGPRDLAVIIDYAHTPDALENVLTTLRDVAPERQLICLFGCGGDRDKTKRPEMAQVAARLADRLVVTSDNCRTEDPEAIIRDIRAGLDWDGVAKSLFITDRREAIRTAILTAPEGATILLAGKGHEDYQIIGHEKLHFDEKEIVLETFKLILK
ncbi:MAG: UDP-N-acetylmuramoyl-L-alanyl-D-glutamate--2,6-diaminopimelate ligase [Bacteroidales bacterium]|nr:UDP-N-acetylmuramoyl-L-alanyl-D-glutamate--2,6-diaminopimelate ligase [Bacteroidales bacterium]